MNAIELNYDKTIKYFDSNDYVTAIIWAKKTVELICREIYTKEKPGPTRDINFNKFISELDKKELVPKIIIPHIRIIQNFGEFANHELDIDPSTVDANSVAPVVSSLKYLMTWYLKDYKNLIPDEGHLTFNSNKSKRKVKKIIIVVGEGGYGHDVGCYDLKQEIEEKYSIPADIVYDTDYLMDTDLPTISVGVSDFNMITRHIISMDESIKSEDNSYELINRATCFDQNLMVAIWAENDERQSAYIEKFINEDDGLKKFIEMSD